MSTAFAAAVRERACQAWQALQAAHRDGDVYGGLLAEDEWHDVRRLARTHGVSLTADRPCGPAGEEGA
ncbi:MAG TPA: hypothetical protein VFV66_08950 [Nonomuraea sp.]|nr:hypothetical protein [Nonomuraea sp.]